MGSLIDLTGKTFSFLTVVSLAGKKNNALQWLCSCKCGADVVVFGEALRKGNTKSCGCLNREVAADRARARNRTHGMTKTKEYAAWRAMHNRCKNKNTGSFNSYGGRGVSVCEEWNSFESFFSDLGPAKKNESLERIDVNGPYCKENCKWIPIEKQAENKQNTVFVTIDGVTKRLTEWVLETGLSRRTIKRNGVISRPFLTPCTRQKRTFAEPPEVP